MPHFVGELSVGSGIIQIDATDDYLAFQTEDGVYWCDVSSSGVPDVIGSYPLNGYQWDGLCLQVQGETVSFIRPKTDPTSSRVFETIDFSVPDSPVVTSSMDLGSVTAAAIEGNLAFISATCQGLAIYDISSPGVPVPVGQILPGQCIGSVSADGNYCWVTYGVYLQAYDITDPSSPVLVYTDELEYSIDGDYTDVAMKGGYGVVQYRYPVAGPVGTEWRYVKRGVYTNYYTEFTLTGIEGYSFPTAGSQMMLSLAVDDGCLIYRDGPSIEIQSYEGNDGFRVRHVLDTTSNPAGIPRIAVHNGRAWASEYGLIRAYEGDWHAEPAVEYRHLISTDAARLLAVQGNRAFLRTISFGSGDFDHRYVSVYNIEDLSSPYREVSVPIHPDGSTLFIRGEYLYWGDCYGNEQSQVVHWPTNTDLGTVCIGGYCDLYPANDPIIYGFGPDCDAGVQIYDLTDPVAPVCLGSALTDFNFTIMSEYDDVLYCQGRESGSYVKEWIVVDVSDAVAPSVLATAPTDYTVRSIEQTGSLMLVGCSDGLRIFDRDAASTPTLVSHLDCGVVSTICASDYILYLGTGVGYEVVDVSDPAYPIIRGTYSAWTSLDGMAVHGDRLLFCEKCQPSEEYRSLTVGLLWCNDPLGTEDHTEDPLPEPIPLKRLAQPFPNPFNPQTTINFSLARSEQASISIFDVAGAAWSWSWRIKRSPPASTPWSGMAGISPEERCHRAATSCAWRPRRRPSTRKMALVR